MLSCSLLSHPTTRVCETLQLVGLTESLQHYLHALKCLSHIESNLTQAEIHGVIPLAVEYKFIKHLFNLSGTQSPLQCFLIPPFTFTLTIIHRWWRLPFVWPLFTLGNWLRAMLSSSGVPWSHSHLEAAQNNHSLICWRQSSSTGWWSRESIQYPPDAIIIHTGYFIIWLDWNLLRHFDVSLIPKKWHLKQI